MKKKYVLVLAAALLIIVCCIFFFAGKPVETEEQAINIAKSYVLKKYKNDFPEYEVSAELENGVWFVLYYIPGWADGGGPDVYILRANGRVLLCRLSL